MEKRYHIHNLIFNIVLGAFFLFINVSLSKLIIAIIVRKNNQVNLLQDQIVSKDFIVIQLILFILWIVVFSFFETYFFKKNNGLFHIEKIIRKEGYMTNDQSIYIIANNYKKMIEYNFIYQSENRKKMQALKAIQSKYTLQKRKESSYYHMIEKYESQIQNVIEDSQSAIAIINGKGIVESMSSSFAYKLGYSKNKIVNFPIEKHLLHISFDQIKNILAVKAYEKMMIDLEIGEKIVTVDIKMIPVLHHDTLYAIVCILHDTFTQNKINKSQFRRNKEFEIINEISELLNSELSMYQVLRHTLEKSAITLNLNFSSIRLLKDNQLDLFAYNSIKNFNINSISKTIDINQERIHLTEVIHQNKIIVINDKEDCLFKDDMLEDNIQKGFHYIYIPLSSHNQIYGVLTFVTVYPIDPETKALFESIAINITIFLQRKSLHKQLKDNYHKTVEALVTASEINLSILKGHSRRVAAYSQMISENMYLKDNDIDDLFMAGLLHDIGKLSFDEDSFEALNDLEKHGFIGAHVAESIGFSKDIVKGIENHHQDYYVLENGAMKFQTSIFANILRIANDFDWLTVKNKHLENPINYALQTLKERDKKNYSQQLVEIIEKIALEKPEYIHEIMNM